MMRLFVENTVSQALTMIPTKIQDIEKTLKELRESLLIDDEQLLAFKGRIIR